MAKLLSIDAFRNQTHRRYELHWRRQTDHGHSTAGSVEITRAEMRLLSTFANDTAFNTRHEPSRRIGQTQSPWSPTRPGAPFYAQTRRCGRARSTRPARASSP